MLFLSFSQNFEDFRLSRALANIENGSYIDIGAYDPVHDSVSAHFYEKGWRGINVEPVIERFEKYASLRDEDLTLNFLIGSVEGEQVFHEILGTGLSTVDVELASKIKDYSKISRLAKVITLDSLFEMSPNEEIHWMKIDVEGSEEQVLNGWVENKKRPWVIVIEATVPRTRVRRSFKNNATLINFDYKFAYFDGLNEYFVHDRHLDLCDSFKTPISIFDQVKTLDYAVSNYVLGENLSRFIDRSPHFTQAIYDYYGNSKIEEVDNANIDLVSQRSDLRPWTLDQIWEHRTDKVFEELDRLVDKNQELEEAIAFQVEELKKVRLTLKLLEESRIFRTTEPIRRVYYLALKMGGVLKSPSDRSLRFFDWTLKQILIKMQLNSRFRLLIFSILPDSISTKLRIYVKNQLYKDVQPRNPTKDPQLSNLLLSTQESSLVKALYSIWNKK